MSEEELDELQDLLNNRKTIKVYEKNVEAINENRKYIGKCYKENDKYIRIVSAKSSNQFRLEAMCFEFPIKLEKINKMTKIFQPNCAFGEIDFEGFFVEDYPLLCYGQLKKIKEISEEEYFTKMDEYVSELKEKIKNNFFDTSIDNKSIFKEKENL